MNKSRSKTDGFTIIEIMIVLAIAGLIIFIVLIAVPSAQRNARNLQRKNDAASVAGAVNTFMNNNGNIAPDGLKNDSGNATLVDIASSSNLASYETAKIGYYNSVGSASNVWGNNADNIYIDTTPIVSPSPATTPNVVAVDNPTVDYSRLNTEAMSIIVGETCNDSGTGAGMVIQNSIAVFFVVEAPGTNGQLECID